MDHLAMFTKFHDQVTTIILILLLLYLYKCIITYVLCYEDLYKHYGCNLNDNKGLIQNSV